MSPSVADDGIWLVPPVLIIVVCKEDAEDAYGVTESSKMGFPISSWTFLISFRVDSEKTDM